jgi:hypothetical protein
VISVTFLIPRVSEPGVRLSPLDPCPGRLGRVDWEHGQSVCSDMSRTFAHAVRVRRISGGNKNVSAR